MMYIQKAERDIQRKYIYFRYHNGRPLTAAHRFRPMFDFGYVALDILYAYPEDSGTYTVVARNQLGEAHSQTQLAVGSKKSLYLDPQHPEGLFLRGIYMDSYYIRHLNYLN